jgi:biopolymer transport protein ExbD
VAGKISGDEDDLSAIAEINVTPFVDVVLVLLVIFMVTAPMLVREQLSVNLPKTTTGEKSATKALAIVLTKEGAVSIADESISMDAIGDRIKQAVAEDPNVQAVITADKDTKHGDVVTVIDQVKRAGLTRFAIQIERN